MGLQFPSCTTFELIEVFIPDQPHQELTAKEIMGLKMAARQQQGNREGGGRGAEAGQRNIITRLDEIQISQIIIGAGFLLTERIMAEEGWISPLWCRSAH